MKYNKRILSKVALTFTLITLVKPQSTWKDAYNRGIGVDTDYCADSTHSELVTFDGKCYPPCVAPRTQEPLLINANCYDPTPYLYTDNLDGTAFIAPGSTYWRDCGYGSISLCNFNSPYKSIWPTVYPLSNACITELGGFYIKCA